MKIRKATTRHGRFQRLFSNILLSRIIRIRIRKFRTLYSIISKDRDGVAPPQSGGISLNCWSTGMPLDLLYAYAIAKMMNGTMTSVPTEAARF